MNFALVYIVNRFFHRLLEFFHHWYIDGSRNLGHRFLNFFEQLDQTFALKVTLKYFFHPLYGDYSIVGRILGFVFRSGRIALALVVYGILIPIFGAVYLLWLALPILIFFNAFINFS